ncbi:maleate cis-trans isomerase family protein [Primorskyibacter sp. S87]|uniref:maleate cis-trans isomerase family protein n=1 Tax=Primorskyibacter sp. S87 TaxID=3415126 RepID=UPI003C7A683D
MHFDYELSAKRPKQIGLVVLQSDESLEPDMRALLPAKVEILVSRIPSAAEVSPETLRAMEPLLTQAAALLPGGAKLSAVGYGCTSASAQIGSERISELIQAGIETPAVTEPVSALLAACRHLNASRIAMLSPYTARVSDKLCSVLTENGIGVETVASFDEPTEERVVRISDASITRAAIEMERATDCDAVFLSCTNLRTLDVIEEIEARTGKPVLSSNQVLAWHLGQLSNFGADMRGPGRLFADLA